MSARRCAECGAKRDSVKRAVTGINNLPHGLHINRDSRWSLALLDQLAGAPACFSGCARAKASILESELAIRVKFKNGAVSTEK
jgi:hypothetical protein